MYKEYYKNHPFTHVSNNELNLKQVVNTNHCALHLHQFEDQLLITSVIDNLVKGASGPSFTKFKPNHGLERRFGSSTQTQCVLKFKETKMKIAIIGSGNLGLSIAKGLVYNNTYTSLYLTKRELNSIEKWEEYNNVKITTDNQEAVKNADIIIFTVQPGQFDGILEQIKGVLTDKHILISAITGYSIQRMETQLGENYPIIRSMPNTAISVGKSMTCLCSNVAGEKRIAIAEAIFNGLGTTIKIAEKQNAGCNCSLC